MRVVDGIHEPDESAIVERLAGLPAQPGAGRSPAGASSCSAAIRARSARSPASRSSTSRSSVSRFARPTAAASRRGAAPRSNTSARLAAPGSPRSSKARASASVSAAITTGRSGCLSSADPDQRPAHAVSSAGRALPSLGQARLGSPARLLLVLLGGFLLAEVLLGVHAPGPGIADRLKQPADLTDVVATNGYPGPSGSQEIVADVDRSEAVVCDSGPRGGVGQFGDEPRLCRPGGQGAVAELARHLLGIAKLMAVPVEPVPVVTDLPGAGLHFPPLILDPALRLILLRVLQARQPALQLLALVAPSVALSHRRLLGRQSLPVLRRRRRDPLCVPGRRLEPGPGPG